ncbi:hypothetical protein HBH51_247930 [Parastagonospora nodorum]|nr:hypothetical protein HBH51_247930 [Parastagonospora nodorum]KAH6110004.1 hypothetical protein HBI69_152330 [Parastagonospora nodorum]
MPANNNRSTSQQSSKTKHNIVRLDLVDIGISENVPMPFDFFLSVPHCHLSNASKPLARLLRTRMPPETSG